MGTVRSLAILAAGAAIGGVALLAYRISQDTGKPIQEALADVPSEVQRLYADLKTKAGDALEKGRAIYEDKQQELAEQLKGITSVQS
jgi:phage terminase Nu1 subunit (DNA packaging protein)